MSQYGNRLFSMPVSDATLSASPRKPQLHRGIGWSSASSPDMGMCTWPSSPAIPDAPLTTCPASMTPPAQTSPDDCCDGRVLTARRPEMHVVGIKRSRVAVVVVDDGQLQPVFYCAADVEATPCRVGEVC